MTHPAPLIADAVSRSYDKRAVVDAASLTLTPGKITALLGRSGAGKSTLLRLFAGLERPDSGEIRIGDTALSNSAIMVPAEARKIGLIFQDFALFPHLNALQNIQFGLAHLPKADAKAHAMDWLARINLASRAEAFPHQLSGGEQQRIAIARALAPDPVAILMDEAFSGLDPALREDVRFVALEAIRAARTPALLVTHDASEAMLSADHLAIMRDGKIVQQGTPAHVYTQPVDKETAAALGPIIVLKTALDPGQTKLNTPFGPLEPAQKQLPTTPFVHIGVRPEAVLITPESAIKAQILSVRRNGPMQQVHISRQTASAHILVPANISIKTGQTVGISLDPAGCVIF